MTIPKTVLHVTDHHIPWQSKRAVALSVEAARTLQPDILVVGGDLVDFYALSKFDNPQKRKANVQFDLDGARQTLADYRQAAPSAAIHYLYGNHEMRLAKYMERRAPELSDVRSLELTSLLGLQDLKIIPRGYGDSVDIGDLRFVHGSRIRKWGGMSAVAQSDSEGRSIAMGHSHRLAHISVRRGTTLLRNYESGCLCLLRQPYLESPPDWQLGFSVFHVHPTFHQWFPIHLVGTDPLRQLTCLERCPQPRRKERAPKYGPRRHRN